MSTQFYIQDQPAASQQDTGPARTGRTAAGLLVPHRRHRHRRRGRRMAG